MKATSSNLRDAAEREDRREAVIRQLQGIGHYSRTGETQKAIESVQDAVAFFPNEPALHFRQLDLVLQYGNLPEPQLLDLSADAIARIKAIELADVAFPVGGREKKAMIGIVRAFREQGWLALQGQALELATLYFPDDSIFKRDFKTCQRQLIAAAMATHSTPAQTPSPARPQTIPQSKRTMVYAR